MPVSSLDPSGPHHATYATRKNGAQADYLILIKAALQKTIQNINFVDPVQTRTAHEALMHEVTEK